MTKAKYKTLDERVAYLEAKLEQQEKIEAQLRKTQDDLLRLATVCNRYFAVLSGNAS